MSSEALNLRKLFFRNTGIQLAGQIVSLFVSAVSIFVLSRYLGVARFGGLNYVLAFYYFFMIFSELGVDVIVVRECSRFPERAGRILSVMRTFRVAAAVLNCVIAAFVVYFVPFPTGLKIPLLIYGMILPLIALELPILIFQVNLKPEYPVIIGIVKSCANLIFMLLLVAAGLGFTGYTAALVCSEVIALVLIGIMTRGHVRTGWAWDWPLIRQILRSSLPMAAAGVFVAVINRSDFLMLERMKDLHEVGLYSAVYKVVNFFEMFPLMVMGTAYPLMSRFAHHDRPRLRRLFLKVSGILTVSGVLGGIVICLLAAPIIHLVCGPAYTEAAQGLRVHVWASTFLYIALTGGNFLICVGKEKVNLLIQFGAAALNVALNFLWIPALGFVGASMATASAYGLICAGTLAAAWIYRNGRAPE